MKSDEKVVYWTQLTHERWKMYLAATTKGLCYVGSQQAPFDELTKWMKKHYPSHVLYEDMDVLHQYKEEVIDYLQGERKEFTITLDMKGTVFQQDVWQALQQVPYGQTVSYTFIAEQIQRPNAVRAVGSAIGANPVLIAIPCHRVIAKNKKLTGYRGGLAMKKDLLAIESQ